VRRQRFDPKSECANVSMRLRGLLINSFLYGRGFEVAVRIRAFGLTHFAGGGRIDRLTIARPSGSSRRFGSLIRILPYAPVRTRSSTIDRSSGHSARRSAKGTIRATGRAVAAASGRVQPRGSQPCTAQQSRLRSVHEIASHERLADAVPDRRSRDGASGTGEQQECWEK
jgi:hypothetical protein